MFFLYITTVNVFLAQLNLSKQHTPTWAVKRADLRYEREDGEKKSHAFRFCSKQRKKTFPVSSERSEKRECLGRHESYSLVKSTLSFSC